MPDAYDVVVIGGGGSGLAAAIEARAAGASVVLLEKNDRLGGSTAWSVGSVTSTCTPHQQRAGIDDNPHDHWADMPDFAGDLAARDNDELRRVLCEHIPDTMRWLIDLGVRFYGPMPEPPHRKPRMHTVLPNSLSFIHHLGNRARATGVQIRFGARAAELMVKDGRVSGVRCAEGAVYEARRGVVVAAGDFTNDPELKTRYIGAQEAKVEGVNLTATGDGQKLALTLGARIVNGDLALGPEIRFVPPSKPNLLRSLPPTPALAATMQWAMEHMPARLLRPFVMSFLTTALAPALGLFEQGARLINRDGKRFCDERSKPALALADQPGKFGYILIDGALARRFGAWPHFVSTAPGIAYAYIPDYRLNRPDVFTEAGSLDGLARRLKMDAGALRESVAGLGQGPYIALGPVRPVFVHNEGGLAVDLEHRVLGTNDAVIPGLWAAGSTGQGGLLLKGHGHHLAWAFVSGRRAGRFAATEASQ
ncbi:MAG: FAD-dependent oxidoreductase [Burkholderiales bacterium]|nr:FAD-dependent oxidoreductase [Burkholderiales bacterium]